MAFIPCMGNGGSEYTETSLWTNPSPTSTFANQSVSLSQSMQNFKYLMVKYRLSTSDATEKNDIFETTKFTADNAGRFAYGGTVSSNYGRLFIKASDTQVTISDCKQFGGTGTTNTNFIPLEILGINELSTEPVIMKKIGEISLPAGTATVTGNLSENISDYKNLLVSMVEYNGSSIPLTGIGSTILGLFTTNYFASNNPVGYYGIGNQGSMSYYSITMQKMSDTSIKFTRSNTTGARTAYVYGIK